MNKERLIKLAEVLESNMAEKHFDMSKWCTNYKGAHHTSDTKVSEAVLDCGTVACIAGWAIAAFDPHAELGDPMLTNAARLLELDEDTAHKLFVPHEPLAEHYDPYQSTPKQAAHVLRHFAETGMVNWSVMKEIPTEEPT